MNSRLLIALLGLPVAASAQVSPTTNLPPSGAASGTVEGARTRTTEVVPNGYITQDGKTYVLKDGRILLLTEAITMTVQPDGTINNFDGEEVTIPEGMMLTADGRIVQSPELPVLGEDPSSVTYSVNRADTSSEETPTTETQTTTATATAPMETATGVGPSGSQENINDDSADSEISATSGVGQNPLSGGTTSSDTSVPGGD